MKIKKINWTLPHRCPATAIHLHNVISFHVKRVNSCTIFIHEIVTFFLNPHHITSLLHVLTVRRANANVKMSNNNKNNPS